MCLGREYTCAVYMRTQAPYPPRTHHVPSVISAVLVRVQCRSEQRVHLRVLEELRLVPARQ